MPPPRAVAKEVSDPAGVGVYVAGAEKSFGEGPEPPTDAETRGPTR